MQEQPFTPDADYCVYCHAQAAGMCADCGVLCCSDCVEIVMRFTSRRAVCTACLAERPTTRPRSWPWIAAAAVVIAVACLLCALGGFPPR